jgi:hypothetical protein
MPLRQLPILYEFFSVQLIPPKDSAPWLAWELTFDRTVRNANENAMPPILGMEVWWRMIIIKHEDDNSKKPANLGHLTLRLCHQQYLQTL